MFVGNGPLFRYVKIMTIFRFCKKTTKNFCYTYSNHSEKDLIVVDSKCSQKYLGYATNKTYNTM